MMLILGIETSCDETSCAVLDGTRQVRSNCVSSSLARHRPFGGVVPEIASRHCLEAIDCVYEAALREAGVSGRDLDLIAVTRGPGLIGSLHVGVAFAKALAFGWGIPLVGVNHLEAHLDANFIEAGRPRRPYVGLIVSGGHTVLLSHRNGEYRMLGHTVDDAAGEAYDKAAKIMGLGYPGGPEIDRRAAAGNPRAVRFTRPKMKGRFDFSFSGIKTAVLYYTEEKGRLSESERNDLCASFQEAVVGWLAEKAFAACRETGARILVTGGGVMANTLLRKRLSEEGRKQKVRVFIPALKYTTDNAAMIARSGLYRFRRAGAAPLDFNADPRLPIGAYT